MKNYFPLREFLLLFEDDRDAQNFLNFVRNLKEKGKFNGRVIEIFEPEEGAVYEHFVNDEELFLDNAHLLAEYINDGMGKIFREYRRPMMKDLPKKRAFSCKNCIHFEREMPVEVREDFLNRMSFYSYQGQDLTTVSAKTIGLCREVYGLFEEDEFFDPDFEVDKFAVLPEGSFCRNFTPKPEVLKRFIAKDEILSLNEVAVNLKISMARLRVLIAGGWFRVASLDESGMKYVHRKDYENVKNKVLSRG
ncbi:hypothetical protein [Carboxydothermus pertinax]|uniref:Uncharacterized protein n=1 Tax=Carboxydothermus pertinax TaxID=870242 RepID=A0A1L8CU29_9THEO|nr:hypothetical protein [Carboxydothermus pertinax]GAV22407.1 hypothetical protein cpu_09170 [Carboxydothermus pertinax]